MEVDPYIVLGLSSRSNVAKKSLKAAKRVAWIKYHPDKNSCASSSRIKQTTALFHNIDDFVEFLSNSTSKHADDLELMEHEKDCAKESAIEKEKR